ncbi:MAG: hypothetical protein JXM69_14315 [Anaerolineae bacterium]|nr:hypothetical protein [Anaerolineae bacterium]
MIVDMGNNTKLAVRLHSQEREWLLNLGNGSVLEGVRNLIEQAKERQLARDDYYLKSKGKKSKSWGNSRW